MRGALIHIFTGLALGVALAGLIHAPTQLVAQQEARTPVVRPKATTAGPWVEEQTVRVSPKVERELERQRTRGLRPKSVRPPRRATAPAPSVLVRTTVPETPVTSPTPEPAYAAKPKPKSKPKPKAPPKSAPAPAPPPKVVASAPQPAQEDEGKKGKKGKKAKKPKKPKKDKAEKQDKHEKKDKADKKGEDDRGTTETTTADSL